MSTLLELVKKWPGSEGYVLAPECPLCGSMSCTQAEEPETMNIVGHCHDCDVDIVWQQDLVPSGIRVTKGKEEVYFDQGISGELFALDAEELELHYFDNTNEKEGE